MPLYEVKALERFLYRTIYRVEADTPISALRMVRGGNEAYDESSIADDPGEWVKAISVEQIEEEPYDVEDGEAEDEDTDE